MRLDQLVIYVDDVPALSAFYEAALGAHVLDEGNPDPAIYRPGQDWVALDLGGLRVELFERRVPLGRDPAGGGPRTILPALRVDDLDAAMARVEAAGGHPAGSGEQAWGRYADYRDPDGNLFNLYWVRRR